MTVVSVVQLVVRHDECMIVAVGVKSSDTKFKPSTDTGLSEVSGALAGLRAVMTGPSNE